MKLGPLLTERVPNVNIEMVDEAGTSSGGTRRGIQGDQVAAAKIALRKGYALKQKPRNHS
jgi:hypothetical protein